MSIALDKVVASRARLRLAMLPPPPKPKSPNEPWTQKLLDIPVVGAVVDSVRAWWSAHPLRPMAKVASEATEAAVAPVARMHPIALVLAAAGLGALFFWTKPWRWALRSALFAGLIPQVLSRTIATMPIDTWMSFIRSALSKSSPSTQPTPGEAAGQAATG